MAIDGIPETLPPIVETAERSPYAQAQPGAGAARKRAAPPAPADQTETLDREPDEAHVLDDLA